MLAMLLATVLWPSLNFASQSGSSSTPIVVMLSLDGFRADYLQKYPKQSNNLKRLADSGIAATGLVPGFPSSTFSNHYSIATGLYPGRHGIIGNGFYDRQRDARFRLGDRSAVEDGTWYGGNPLWVAVEKAGMRAASFFWVGSEADIQGIRPSYYKIYDGSVPNQKRVDQVLDWLALPEGQRPNLVTLYFSTVDSVGHRFGPNSSELPEAIASVDRQVGRLMAGLAQIDRPVYLMVVSDHGMQQVDMDQRVYLEDYLNLQRWRGGNRIILGGPFGFFYSDEADLLTRSQAALTGVEGLTVFPPDQFPAQLNFPQRGPRIPDFVAVVDAPGYISLKRDSGPPPLGTHGYLPQATPTMQGIFYAAGPAIPPMTRIPPIDNVHVYPLVLHLLGLDAGDVDGDLSVLQPFLRGQ
jgi:alkaline phosphatase D